MGVPQQVHSSVMSAAVAAVSADSGDRTKKTVFLLARRRSPAAFATAQVHEATRSETWSRKATEARVKRRKEGDASHKGNHPLAGVHSAHAHLSKRAHATGRYALLSLECALCSLFLRLTAEIFHLLNSKESNVAYAAYREHPGQPRTANTTPFHVLDVAVASRDARSVRQHVARCTDAGVVRCEPLLNGRSTQESDAPRVRLMIRLPLASYAQVLHRLIEAIPSGEIGRLITWRDHLARCGLCHGL